MTLTLTLHNLLFQEYLMTTTIGDPYPHPLYWEDETQALFKAGQCTGEWSGDTRNAFAAIERLKCTTSYALAYTNTLRGWLARNTRSKPTASKE